MPVGSVSEATSLMEPLRRQRSSRLLIGQLVSRFGDAIYLVGMAAYAVQQRDSGLLAGALLGQTVGAVATLTVSGSMADRLGARRMLLVADALRFTALVCMVVLCTRGADGYAVFLGLGLLLGIGDGAFEPALTVALTEVLPAQLLLPANTLHSIFFRGGAMAGAAAAGLMLTVVSPAAALAVDAATFGLSLLLILSTRWQVAETAEHQPLVNAAMQGVSYVLSRSWLFMSVVTFALFVALAVSAPRVLLPLSLSGRGGAVSDYGWVLGAQGLGAMLVGLASARLPTPAHPAATIFRCMVLTSTCCVLLGFADRVALAAGIAAVGGASLSFATIHWATLVQRNVDPAFLARVSSLDWLVSSALAPVTLACLPWLLSIASASRLLIVFGLVSASVCAVGLCLPSIRRLRYAEEGGTGGA